VQILLASGNPKKRSELIALLAPLGIELLVPADVGGIPEVEEDGDTFEANARKKAIAAAGATGHWCLADDSGLCVDALDGAPGVRSARFSGEAADADANNVHLLQRLEEAGALAATDRGAHFVCCLALARPDESIAAVLERESHGQILDDAKRAQRAEGGFGYDPLFLFEEEGQPGSGSTFAEMDSAAKSAVSHRGRALRALASQLPALIPTP